MSNPKITIEPVDLSKQKIIESRLYELELGHDRFIYRLRFRASEAKGDDEMLEWVEVDNDFEVIYPKRRFAGIEKLWLQEDKRWKIVLCFDGVGFDLKLYFKKQVACQAVFDQLVEYFFNQ